jgi:hypothetical protein
MPSAALDDRQDRMRELGRRLPHRLAHSPVDTAVLGRFPLDPYSFVNRRSRVQFPEMAPGCRPIRASKKPTQFDFQATVINEQRGEQRGRGRDGL